MRTAQRLRSQIARGRAPAAGYTLIELATALVLASLVAALAGSVFVASLGLWRRGHEIREAEAQAAVVADAMMRDVRRGSQASQVMLGTPFPVGDAVALLSVPQSAGAAGEGGPGPPRWVLYVHDEAAGRVRRLVLSSKEDGTVVTHDERVVGLGVSHVTVVPSNGGVVVEIEVKRGRAVGRQRVTAAPRNP